MNQNILDDYVLTADAAAKYLKVSKRKIYRLLKKREIRSFKLGGRYHILESHLKMWKTTETKRSQENE